MNNLNPTFAVPVISKFEFGVAQLLELEVYSYEILDENNFGPPVVIGTL